MFSRFWGVLTSAELSAHARALSQDPRFEPTFCQIANLRDVRSFDGSDIEIMDVAALNPFENSVRRAALVTSRVALDIVRVYRASVGGEENVLITHSLSEAIAWLGLDPSTSWPSAPTDWTMDRALEPGI